MAYQQQRQSAERGARQIAQQQTSAAASTGIRRFSRSPLAAAEKPSDGKAPPPRPRQPNVDSTIAPRPRNRVSPALPSEAPAARRVGSRPNPSGQPRSSSPVPGSSPPPDGDKEKKQRPPSQQPRPQAS
jgi:hypothetical protein